MRTKTHILKISAITFSAIVLFAYLGGVFMFADAAENSGKAIVNAKNMAFSEAAATMFILNENDTISAYDFTKNQFTLIRKSIVGISNMRSILVGPDGSYIAIFSVAEKGLLKVSIFKPADILSKEQGAPTAAYILGQFPIGTVVSKFSDDGKTFFVAYGEKGLEFLDTAKANRRSVGTGETPIGLELDNQGHLLVLNEKTRNLDIIDISKGASMNKILLGPNPRRIIFNSVTNKAYVSHAGSDEIYILDIKNASVAKRIKVGSDPDIMTYDKSSGDVFTANNSSGTISVIFPDFSVKTIDLKSPAYFNSSPLLLHYLESDKKLFILNMSSAQILVYDPTTSQVIKSEKTDFSPVFISGSEKLRKIFIHHANANSIFTMDGKTLDIARIPEEASASQNFFSKPQGIAIDETRNLIFVSNVGSNKVTVIDGETQKPVVNIPINTSPQTVGLNTATDKLYSLSPVDNTVAIIDVSQKNYPVKTIQVGKQPRGASINKKTNTVYISNAGDSSISIIDGAKEEVIKTVTFPGQSFPLVSSVNEEKNKVYVALYGSNSIQVIDGETGNIEQEILVGQNPIWVRYIPELKRIFVSVEGEKKIIVIDPANNQVVQSIQISGIPYRIFFRKDVNNYVYINHRNESLVTILASEKDASEFKIIKEKIIPFWGETDKLFNMVALNTKTNLAYFTSGRNNNVAVVKNELDEEGIMKPVWYTTIGTDGTMIYSQEAKEKIKKGEGLKTIFPSLPSLAWPAAAFVAILALGTVIFILFTKKRSPPTA